jgi:hypothetical protein
VSADADFKRRSAWRAFLPVLAFVAITLVAVFLRLSGGDAAVGALALRGGVGLLAIWAVVDGLRRGFGTATFLGTGRGMDRLFGFAQVAISVGTAVALLPNTIGFIELLAALVAG